MGCKHEWKKETDTIIKPDVDVLLKHLQGQYVAGLKISPELFQQTHILVLSCKLCGKIYKQVTRSN